MREKEGLKNLYVFFDGGLLGPALKGALVRRRPKFRNFDAYAGFAFAFERPANVFAAGGRLLKGVSTSPKAEYVALSEALNVLLHFLPAPEGAPDPERVRLLVVGDSELVINQLKGLYALRDASLRPLHAVARALLAQASRTFAATELMHVKRACNPADAAGRLCVRLVKAFYVAEAFCVQKAPCAGEKLEETCKGFELKRFLRTES